MRSRSVNSRSQQTPQRQNRTASISSRNASKTSSRARVYPSVTSDSHGSQIDGHSSIGGESTDDDSMSISDTRSTLTDTSSLFSSQRQSQLNPQGTHPSDWTYLEDTVRRWVATEPEKRELIVVSEQRGDPLREYQKRDLVWVRLQCGKALPKPPVLKVNRSSTILSDSPNSMTHSDRMDQKQSSDLSSASDRGSVVSGETTETEQTDLNDQKEPRFCWWPALIMRSEGDSVDCHCQGCLSQIRQESEDCNGESMSSEKDSQSKKKRSKKKKGKKKKSKKDRNKESKKKKERCENTPCSFCRNLGYERVRVKLQVSPVIESGLRSRMPSVSSSMIFSAAFPEFACPEYFDSNRDKSGDCLLDSDEEEDSANLTKEEKRKKAKQRKRKQKNNSKSQSASQMRRVLAIEKQRDYERTEEFVMAQQSWNKDKKRALKMSGEFAEILNYLIDFTRDKMTEMDDELGMDEEDDKDGDKDEDLQSMVVKKTKKERKITLNMDGMTVTKSEMISMLEDGKVEDMITGSNGRFKKTRMRIKKKKKKKKPSLEHDLGLFEIEVYKKDVVPFKVFYNQMSLKNMRWIIKEHSFLLHPCCLEGMSNTWSLPDYQSLMDSSLMMKESTNSISHDNDGLKLKDFIRQRIMNGDDNNNNNSDGLTQLQPSLNPLHYPGKSEDLLRCFNHSSQSSLSPLIDDDHPYHHHLMYLLHLSQLLSNLYDKLEQQNFGLSLQSQLLFAHLPSFLNRMHHLFDTSECLNAEDIRSKLIHSLNKCEGVHLLDLNKRRIKKYRGYIKVFQWIEECAVKLDVISELLLTHDHQNGGNSNTVDVDSPIIILLHSMINLTDVLARRIQSLRNSLMTHLLYAIFSDMNLLTDVMQRKLHEFRTHTSAVSSSSEDPSGSIVSIDGSEFVFRLQRYLIPLLSPSATHSCVNFEMIGRLWLEREWRNIVVQSVYESGITEGSVLNRRNGELENLNLNCAGLISANATIPDAMMYTDNNNYHHHSHHGTSISQTTAMTFSQHALESGVSQMVPISNCSHQASVVAANALSLLARHPTIAPGMCVVVFGVGIAHWSSRMTRTSSSSSTNITRKQTRPLMLDVYGSVMNPGSQVDETLRCIRHMWWPAVVVKAPLTHTRRQRRLHHSGPVVDLTDIDEIAVDENEDYFLGSTDDEMDDITDSDRQYTLVRLLGIDIDAWYERVNVLLWPDHRWRSNVEKKDRLCTAAKIKSSLPMNQSFQIPQCVRKITSLIPQTMLLIENSRTDLWMLCDYWFRRAFLSPLNNSTTKKRMKKRSKKKSFMIDVELNDVGSFVSRLGRRFLLILLNEILNEKPFLRNARFDFNFEDGEMEFDQTDTNQTQNQNQETGDDPNVSKDSAVVSKEAAMIENIDSLSKLEDQVMTHRFSSQSDYLSGVLKALAHSGTWLSFHHLRSILAMTRGSLWVTLCHLLTSNRQLYDLNVHYQVFGFHHSLNLYQCLFKVEFVEMEETSDSSNSKSKMKIIVRNMDAINIVGSALSQQCVTFESRNHSEIFGLINISKMRPHQHPLYVYHFPSVPSSTTCSIPGKMYISKGRSKLQRGELKISSMIQWKWIQDWIIQQICMLRNNNNNQSINTLFMKYRNQSDHFPLLISIVNRIIKRALCLFVLAGRLIHRMPTVTEFILKCILQIIRDAFPFDRNHQSCNIIDDSWIQRAVLMRRVFSFVQAWQLGFDIKNKFRREIDKVRLQQKSFEQKMKSILVALNHGESLLLNNDDDSSFSFSSVLSNRWDSALETMVNEITKSPTFVCRRHIALNRYLLRIHEFIFAEQVYEHLYCSMAMKQALRSRDGRRGRVRSQIQSNDDGRLSRPSRIGLFNDENVSMMMDDESTLMLNDDLVDPSMMGTQVRPSVSAMSQGINHDVNVDDNENDDPMMMTVEPVIIQALKKLNEKRVMESKQARLRRVLVPYAHSLHYLQLKYALDMRECISDNTNLISEWNEKCLKMSDHRKSKYPRNTSSSSDDTTAHAAAAAVAVSHDSMTMMNESMNNISRDFLSVSMVGGLSPIRSASEMTHRRVSIIGDRQSTPERSTHASSEGNSSSSSSSTNSNVSSPSSNESNIEMNHSQRRKRKSPDVSHNFSEMNDSSLLIDGGKPDSSSLIIGGRDDSELSFIRSDEPPMKKLKPNSSGSMLDLWNGEDEAYAGESESDASGLFTSAERDPNPSELSSSMIQNINVKKRKSNEQLRREHEKRIQRRSREVSLRLSSAESSSSDEDSLASKHRSDFETEMTTIENGNEKTHSKNKNDEMTLQFGTLRKHRERQQRRRSKSVESMTSVMSSEISASVSYGHQRNEHGSDASTISIGSNGSSSKMRRMKDTTKSNVKKNEKLNMIALMEEEMNQVLNEPMNSMMKILDNINEMNKKHPWKTVSIDMALNVFEEMKRVTMSAIEMVLKMRQFQDEHIFDDSKDDDDHHRECDQCYYFSWVILQSPIKKIDYLMTRFVTENPLNALKRIELLKFRLDRFDLCDKANHHQRRRLHRLQRRHRLQQKKQERLFAVPLMMDVQRMTEEMADHLEFLSHDLSFIEFDQEWPKVNEIVNRIFAILGSPERIAEHREQLASFRIQALMAHSENDDDDGGDDGGGHPGLRLESNQVPSEMQCEMSRVQCLIRVLISRLRIQLKSMLQASNDQRRLLVTSQLQSLFIQGIYDLAQHLKQLKDILNGLDFSPLERTGLDSRCESVMKQFEIFLNDNMGDICRSLFEPKLYQCDLIMTSVYHSSQLSLCSETSCAQDSKISAIAHQCLVYKRLRWVLLMLGFNHDHHQTGIYRTIHEDTQFLEKTVDLLENEMIIKEETTLMSDSLMNVIDEPASPAHACIKHCQKSWNILSDDKKSSSLISITDLFKELCDNYGQSKLETQEFVLCDSDINDDYKKVEHRLQRRRRSFKDRSCKSRFRSVSLMQPVLCSTFYYSKFNPFPDFAILRRGPNQKGCKSVIERPLQWMKIKDDRLFVPVYETRDAAENVALLPDSSLMMEVRDSSFMRLSTDIDTDDSSEHNQSGMMIISNDTLQHRQHHIHHLVKWKTRSRGFKKFAKDRSLRTHDCSNPYSAANREQWMCYPQTHRAKVGKSFPSIQQQPSVHANLELIKTCFLN